MTYDQQCFIISSEWQLTDITRDEGITEYLFSHSLSTFTDIWTHGAVTTTQINNSQLLIPDDLSTKCDFHKTQIDVKVMKHIKCY